MALTLEKAISGAYWHRKYHKLLKRFAGKKAKEQFAAALSRLGSQDTCIDLGANIGDFTARLAASGATVHAFEPDPYAFSKLAQRFRSADNVVLLNGAAGLEDGEITLYRSPAFESDPDIESQSSSVFADKTNIDTSSAFTVRQIDLLRYLEEIDEDIAILKMDIEGAEVPILEQLLDHPIASRIGWMFVETHETRIPSLARRTRALRRRSWFRRQPRMNLWWH